MLKLAVEKRCVSYGSEMAEVITKSSHVGFLLPIINKLISNSSLVRAPFSFILVPTAELAIQVVTIVCHVINMLLVDTFSIS